MSRDDIRIADLIQENDDQREQIAGLNDQCSRYRLILVRVARLLGDLTEIALPPRLAAECIAILRLIAKGRHDQDQTLQPPTNESVNDD